jgi:hypothetical protein
MEEVIAGEAVMSQSLFDDPQAGAAGLSLSEAQEELRGELALLAERLDGMDRSLQRFAATQATGREELQRQQTHLVETLTAERRRRDRLLLGLVGGGLILAMAALVLSILGVR